MSQRVKEPALNTSDNILDKLFEKVCEKLTGFLEVELEKRLSGALTNTTLAVRTELDALREAKLLPHEFKIACEHFAPRALAFIENLIDGKIPGATLALRAKYAEYMLACAGHAPIRKLHYNPTEHLSQGEIEAIKKRALAAFGANVNTNNELTAPGELTTEAFLEANLEIALNDQGELEVRTTNEQNRTRVAQTPPVELQARHKQQLSPW